MSWLLLILAASPDGGVPMNDTRTRELMHTEVTIALPSSIASEEREPAFAEGFAVFEQIECPYQAARTGWLLGDDARAEAERTFVRLGATLPAD